MKSMCVCTKHFIIEQDTSSRLMSISKLLATLPSANYHTLKALSHHLFK